jgi:hypothetical protein
VLRPAKPQSQITTKAAAQTSDKETIKRNHSPVVLTKRGLKTEEINREDTTEGSQTWSVRRRMGKDRQLCSRTLEYIWAGAHSHKCQEVEPA